MKPEEAEVMLHLHARLGFKWIPTSNCRARSASVFDSFGRTRSASAVVQYSREQQVAWPRRVVKGTCPGHSPEITVAGVSHMSRTSTTRSGTSGSRNRFAIGSGQPLLLMCGC